MITSPTGRQLISVHGSGPQHETMSLSQFRDAVGYSKQSPLPARKVTIPGIVKLAGSVIAIKSSGVVDGNRITGLSATNGLLGASVRADGLAEGVTVIGISVPSSPGVSGTVEMSNVAPFAPTTGMPQPIEFHVTVRDTVISGLAVTDGLVGAGVSGGGLPEGSKVGAVIVPAVPAANMAMGTPGEVQVITRAAPPKEGAKPSEVAAIPEPTDLVFAIPVEPIAVSDGISRLVLSPSEPLDALTVLLPPKPVDGQQVFIYSAQPVAKLTVLANAGQVLAPPAAAKEAKPPKKGEAVEAPTIELAANTGIGFLYSLSNATWDRVQ